MATTFELKTTHDDLYYFNFLNGNGEIILMSGEYEEKASAEKAIKDVQVGSLMSQQIAAGKVANGDTFFVIKDNAGQIIMKSVLYADAMVFDNALHTVKDNACVAEVKDLTL